MERDGFVIDIPHGNSMWPMLRDRKDRFVVRPLQGPLRKFDIPLYYRPQNSHMTVHRVIGVTERGYEIRGDNCYFTEHDIAPENIVGVITEFYRGEKRFSVQARGYRCYVRLWTLCYPLRWLWHHTGYRVWRTAKRVAVKIKRTVAGRK